MIYELLALPGICGRPRTPSSGRVHGNSFLDGDEVTFSCDKNYDLSGKHTLRCVGQRWDSSLPECKGECPVSSRKNERKKDKKYFLYLAHRAYSLISLHLSRVSI